MTLWECPFCWKTFHDRHWSCCGESGHLEAMEDKTPMNLWQITLTEAPDGEGPSTFECWATDMERAIEQAEIAFPNAIVHTARVVVDE